MDEKKTLGKAQKKKILGIHGDKSTDFLIKLKLGREIEDRV